MENGLMLLRPYQQRAIDQLYQWFNSNSKGNPCLVLPTGSGKSHIIAALCKDALSKYPETRILMLTHQKELIEQNAEKMLLHWPDAPLGIYSASIGTKDLNQITFAGIQSIRKKAKEIGHIDLVLIDEAHLVSHKEEGGYRNLINDLLGINHNLRVIGLTASPFRLGHGLITDKPAIFDALIEPTSIEELINKGYLARLRSRLTKAQLEVDGVHKRGGEFIESELQAKVNTKDKNESIVQEVIKLAGDRKSWIFFCAGVKHAQNVCDVLQKYNIDAHCITGETPKAEREKLINDFKAGKIRALTNANVLTTGFDAPNIDLIAMLRPTMSAGLYMQMAGRGLRVKDHTGYCLVLDFAGVVKTHGPITNIQIQSKQTKGTGEAPVKVCDNCFEICHVSAKICPTCATPFPEPKPKKLKLHNDDIMGLSNTKMEVTSWSWKEHISRASGKRMIRVDYYGALSDPPITEYLTVTHEGWAGTKAVRLLAEMAQKTKTVISSDLFATIDAMNQSTPPKLIEYRKNGKYNQIMKREWNEA